MQEIVFKIIFIVLFVIYVAIRVPYESAYKKTTKSKSVRPKFEKTLVLINFLGLGLVPLLWVFTPWLNSFNMYFCDYVRFIGAFLMTLSLILFWWIHKTLGRNWSPILEIHQQHKLITSGPYKFIRHPMYAQIWLWVISQSILISNSLVGSAALLAWSIVYFSRVRVEEGMMLKEFGIAYREYMNSTGRVFPKL